MFILLTYSNNIEYPLCSLEDERIEVDRLFDDLDAKRILQYKIVPSAKVIEDLTRWTRHDRAKELVLFSFSGHSTGTRLVLENEHIRCDGLARLLGRKNCPNIKVVFLNGCLTYRCRSFFEKSGIPVIISTTEAVDDRLAKVFSTTFFEKLANNSTVYDSYQRALEVISSIDAVEGNEEEHTSDGISNEISNPHKKVPEWHFYFQEERFKNWKLDMGLDDPPALDGKKNFKLETLISDLKTYKSLIEGNAILPGDCPDLLYQFEFTISNIDNISISTLAKTNIIDAIEKSKPHLDYLERHCLLIDAEVPLGCLHSMTSLAKHLDSIIRNIG